MGLELGILSKTKLRLQSISWGLFVEKGFVHVWEEWVCAWERWVVRDNGILIVHWSHGQRDGKGRKNITTIAAPLPCIYTPLWPTASPIHSTLACKITIMVFHGILWSTVSAVLWMNWRKCPWDESQRVYSRQFSHDCTAQGRGHHIGCIVCVCVINIKGWIKCWCDVMWCIVMLQCLPNSMITTDWTMTNRLRPWPNKMGRRMPFKC